MDNSPVFQLLTDTKLALAAHYGMTSIALFGSMAQDAAPPGANIDILVAYETLTMSERYSATQDRLDDLSGSLIDMVAVKSLPLELRSFVEKEVIRVKESIAGVEALQKAN